MRIEEKALEQTKEKSSRSSSKKNRRGKKKSMSSVVQKLFDTCKEVFSAGGAGIVPSPGDVERLELVLDSMKPADVGLNQEMPYFQRMKSKGAPPITYLHLYECDQFSIGIFCLPPSGVIPLHNHPGMTVFSKLLFGSMHIKSYDWADIPCSSDKTLNASYFQPSGVRLANVKTDTLFTAPCKPSILYPAAGGNMHCFTAKTSCAVLDVLGPPYNDSEGRHCAYYRDYPYASFSGSTYHGFFMPASPLAQMILPLRTVDTELGSEREGYAWLEETEKPDDFLVKGAKYEGPKIVEK